MKQLRGDTHYHKQFQVLPSLCWYVKIIENRRCVLAQNNQTILATYQENLRIFEKLYEISSGAKLVGKGHHKVVPDVETFRIEVEMDCAKFTKLLLKF